MLPCQSKEGHEGKPYTARLSQWVIKGVFERERLFFFFNVAQRPRRKGMGRVVLEMKGGSQENAGRAEAAVSRRQIRVWRRSREGSEGNGWSISREEGIPVGSSLEINLTYKGLNS